MCWVSFRRGLTRTIAGDLSAGLADFTEVLDLLGDGSEESYLTAFTLVSMGIVHVLSGDYAAADQAGRRALELQLTRDDLLGQGASLNLLAWVAAQDARYPRSACLFGAADTVWALVGAVPFVGNPKLSALHTTFDAATRQALGDRRYTLLHRQGAKLPRPAAVKFAVSNHDTAVQAASDALTRREREVAVLVTEGLSNRVIAKRLAIAKHAADTHVGHILAKLGLATRAEIAALIRGEPGAQAP